MSKYPSPGRSCAFPHAGRFEAGLASFGVVQTTVVDSGAGLLRLAVSDTEAEHEDGTDAAPLAAGWATVTVVRPLCGGHPVSVVGTA